MVHRSRNCLVCGMAIAQLAVFVLVRHEGLVVRHSVAERHRVSDGLAAIPAIGFGTAFWEECGKLCSNEVDGGGWEYRPCESCMTEALQTGYRHFDLASLYTGAEEAMGRVLRRGSVPREAVFLTSKIHPAYSESTGEDSYTFEGVLQSFNRSLELLGTNYLDLYLLHWHAREWKTAWKAMELLKLEGRVHAIGVSNFDLELLVQMWADPEIVIRPSVVQNFVDAVYQSKALRSWCAEHGVVVTAYSALTYIGQESLSSYRESRAVLARISRRHRKTKPQIISRWLLEEGARIIPKTRTLGRMRENLDGVLDFRLSPEDLRDIRSLDQPFLRGPPTKECSMLRELVVR